MSESTPVSTGRCPACGANNQCGVAAGNSSCWCFTLELTMTEATASAPAGLDCLCENCLSGRTPSPCTGACRLDAVTGLCTGCLRTGDEIMGWGGRTAEQRREVYLQLQRRRERLEPRAGNAG